jgi:hypothetical protein
LQAAKSPSDRENPAKTRWAQEIPGVGVGRFIKSIRWPIMANPGGHHAYTYAILMPIARPRVHGDQSGVCWRMRFPCLTQTVRCGAALSDVRRIRPRDAKTPFYWPQEGNPVRHNPQLQ